LAFDNGTNVGIGTQAPDGLLHLYLNANSQLGFYIENPNSGSAAKSRLQFGAKSLDTDLVFSAYNSGHQGNGLIGVQAASLTELCANTNSSGLAVGTRGASSFIVSTNATPRMRVLSTGELSVGTITTIPSGVGIRVDNGDVGIMSQLGLRLYDSDNSNYLVIKSPSSISSNYTLTMPADDGNSYQFLQTDGSGTLSWSSTIQGDVQLINTQVGTTYTLALADAGKLITLNNGSPISVTVPLNSSVAFPTGTHIDFAQLGAGQVTIAGDVGVTLNYTPGNKLRAQYSGASIIKIGTDTWMLFGDISA
jgi:hypothetical protein